MHLSCCLKFASKHSAQLSFCLKWATFYIKLKLVQNTVRNPAVAKNWPDVGLRNCCFAWNWPVLLGSQNMWKTPCTTFLLLQIDPKSHCATVVFLGRQSLRKTPCALFLLLEIAFKTLCASVVLLRITVFIYTTWQKILTVWPITFGKESAELRIYLSWCKWKIISKKLRFAILDKTCKKRRAQRCWCSKLASSHTVQLSFRFKLARIVRKRTPVRNCARNCPVNQNWWLWLKS